MKRHWLNIVLLLAVASVAFWLWSTRDRVSEGEKQRRENNLFGAWRREELSRVEIAHEGETIVLVRDARKDGAWRMTSPRAERADQAAAERLLTTLEFATVARKVGSDDSASFGLESPRAAGSVAMGALVFRFVLGGPAPRPEGASYFKVDDGPPVVVSKELTSALLAPADTLRDRTVVPYLSLDIAKFSVEREGGGFALSRLDERSFRIDGARGARASRSAVDKVWSALAEMRAEAFPKDADADRLTAKRRLTITMVPKDGKPKGVLVVGEACPGQPNDLVVLRLEPSRVAACAPRGAIEALESFDDAALVDLRPLSFRHDEIEELRLEALGGDAGAAPPAIEIARKGTTFHEREPVDRDLDAAEGDAASDLLSRMEAVQASKLGAAAPFTAAFRARVRAGDHEETVELAPLGGPVVTARRLHDGALLELPAASALLFVPRQTTLRSRVLGSESRPVKRVVLRCGVPQELVDSGAGLRLVEPAGYETDGSITQLVDGILRGKAAYWAADADDGRLGLDGEGRAMAEPCRVVIAFADDKSPLTLRLGNPADGGYFARFDGAPEVFVAPRSLVVLAKRIYVSHAALRVEPAAITSVKVTAAGRVLPAGEPREMAEAAGGLFASHAIALGAPDVGKPDVEVEIFTADGGPPKRVVCGSQTTGGALDGDWRRCATPAVRAVFAVTAARVERLLRRTSPGDAGR